MGKVSTVQVIWSSCHLVISRKAARRRRAVLGGKVIIEELAAFPCLHGKAVLADKGNCYGIAKG
jgi:hypothetical protein